MKKVLLWCIPTFLIVFSLAIKRFIDVHIVDLLFLIFYIFVLFFAPCYYVIMTYPTRHNKKKFVKSFLSTIAFSLVNAILVCPESIQVYLGLRVWKVHDIDMLPLFVIVPITVIVIGNGLVMLISKKDKTQG